MMVKSKFKMIGYLPVWAGLIFWFTSIEANCQQILWAKLFALPDIDLITCATKDSSGNVYAGGKSHYRSFLPGFIPRAMIYKLNSEGDTLFSLWPGIYGEVQAMTVDYEGVIKIAVFSESNIPFQSGLHLLSMSPEGFIFKRDTIPTILYVTHSCIGKDSSWILCGFRPNDVNALFFDTYVQRIRKDGTIEPYFSLNNNISEQASRVEQLPNGKYLVSVSGGERLISYTFDENLSNPQPMETWYQTPDMSGLSTGYVSRINNQRYMIAAQGGPCFVGMVDSIKQIYWLRKDIGTQVPPQAMVDGSVIFGYVTSVGVNNTLYRLASDSSQIWFITIKDSLAAKGINGVMQVKVFNYLDDESAVAAGVMYNGSLNREDPIFIKIANVGTPVTALSKPKRGTLSNETLAPWPNPSGGTLYLKQHFDKAEVHFYTVSGREVQTDTVRFGQPINISSFAPGLYLYRAVIDGKPFSGKVVRN
jgi:hypothetical protein